MLGVEVILRRLFCGCLHVQITVQAVHVTTILDMLIANLSCEGVVVTQDFSLPAVQGISLRVVSQDFSLLSM